MTGTILATDVTSYTRQSRTRGRHRKQPPPSRFSLGKVLAAGAAATLLAAAAVFTGVLTKWVIKASVPLAAPLLSAPPASGPSEVSMPAVPPRAATPGPAAEPEPAVVAPPQPVTAFATDRSGFLHSTARCDSDQTARAIARTEQSLVVICADQRGQIEYRGVRLSDEAMLKAGAWAGASQGFVARNYRVTYALSPTALTVSSGGTVLKNEPMVEYREQALAG